MKQLLHQGLELINTAHVGVYLGNSCSTNKNKRLYAELLGIDEEVLAGIDFPENFEALFDEDGRLRNRVKNLWGQIVSRLEYISSARLVVLHPGEIDFDNSRPINDEYTLNIIAYGISFRTDGKVAAMISKQPIRLRSKALDYSI